MSDLGKCRSCGAAIHWIEMPSGKKNPLDVEPSENGNIALLDDKRAEVLTGEALANSKAAKIPLYLSHFATCKHAASHRKPK